MKVTSLLTKTSSAVLLSALLATGMQANAAIEIYEDDYSYKTPDGSSMALDAFVAKPIEAAMVAGGFATWFVSLPFTYGTDTEEGAWQKLVVEPADRLSRCLGCTEAQDESYLRGQYIPEE